MFSAQEFHADTSPTASAASLRRAVTMRHRIGRFRRASEAEANRSFSRRRPVWKLLRPRTVKHLDRLGLASRRRNLTNPMRIVTARGRLAAELCGDVSAEFLWPRTCSRWSLSGKNESLAAVWALLPKRTCRRVFADRPMPGHESFLARSTHPVRASRRRMVQPRALHRSLLSGANFGDDVQFRKRQPLRMAANLAHIHCRARDFRRRSVKSVATFEAAEFSKDAWVRDSRFSDKPYSAAPNSAAKPGWARAVSDLPIFGHHICDMPALTRPVRSRRLRRNRVSNPCLFAGRSFVRTRASTGPVFSGKMHFEDIEVAQSQSPAGANCRNSCVGDELRLAADGDCW